jgi:hypothetical protein
MNDKVHIIVERAPDGKMRVTSRSWNDERVILKESRPGIRNIDHRLLAHKARDWDPTTTRRELGQRVSDDADFASAYDFVVTRNAARLLRITLCSFEPMGHKALDR